MHLPAGLRLLQSILASRLVGMSAGAPLTPKAATLTAVVPTSTPIMTSVVPLFMSLGLDGGGLMENSVDEVLVPAEPGFENV